MCRICDEFVTYVIQSAIKYGQENHDKDPRQLFPHFSVLQIRSRIIETAICFSEKVLQQNKSVSHITMVFDAGREDMIIVLKKMTHRLFQFIQFFIKYWDIMIS